MAAGTLRRADPHFAAMQLNGLVKQFFVWPQFLMGEAPQFAHSKAEIIAECVAMFMARYAAPGDGPRAGG